MLQNIRSHVSTSKLIDIEGRLVKLRTNNSVVTITESQYIVDVRQPISLHNVRIQST